MTVFSGTPCALSNLHDVDIEIDGIKYNSSEQYYQSQKCRDLNRGDLAEKVMKAKSGYSSMTEGNALRPSKRWTCDRGVEIMKKGVRAKFALESCKQILLSKNGLIAEATRHKLWGTGVSFNRDAATDKNQWEGLNLMGEILTTLRDEIAESQRSNNNPPMDISHPTQDSDK